MNIISLAVSTFITNYIITIIIRALPIRHKRNWQIGIISLSCLLEIGGYLWIVIASRTTDFLTIIEIIGSCLGVLIGYIASLMMVLDGVTLFKSKRLREFERSYNQKDGASVPRKVLGSISLSLGLLLLVYGIITAIHYNSRLLWNCIGLFIGGVAFTGVAIYFFISSTPQHKSIHAENLLFIVDFEGTKNLYLANLSKENTIESYLGKIIDLYILDEFGLIITPSSHYIVKGIKLEYSSKDLMKEIQMNLYEGKDFDEAIAQFQRYNRKKIVLDENHKIVKTTIIK